LKGVYFGVLAHQLSLETFGVQSLIEILAAALVLFRFGLAADEAGVVYDRERYGTRAVGGSLIALALLAGYGAATDLIAHTGPDTSSYGILVAGIAAIAMLICWRLKKKAGTILKSPVMLSINSTLSLLSQGTILKSPVMLSDAKCSLMCM
jgi:divalent metal cation (Fe/Co/Zn/Cd) transporter